MCNQEKNMSVRKPNCHSPKARAGMAAAGPEHQKTMYSYARGRNLFFLLLSLVLWCMTKTTLAAPGDSPPTVVVAPVTMVDVVPATEYVGHVEAIQAVDLRARVEGFLEKVFFQEGDYVHAGDVMYQIEQETYKARAAADQARVDQAKADLERADSYLQRLRAARSESIPATDMDNAVANVFMTRAKLAEAEADLTLANINLDYTTIRAPISGRIGRTEYTVGNLVNPGSGTLARIVQMDPIRVVYSISENDLVAIQRALVEVDGNEAPLLAPQLRLVNGELLPGIGHVSFVDNQVNPATGTIAVRAEFANPGNILIPGQYVTVLVKPAAPKMMPVVPQAAVLVDKNGRYVLTVDANGTAVPRPITIGPEVGIDWAVESGLEAGEEIIVSGIQKVRPGQPVQVTHAEPEGK
jgi:RND family efflux transporter MFP subunit